MLGAYIVNCYMFFDSLIIMWCPTLSLIMIISKSILSDMNIATPVFFLSLFA